MPAPMTTTRFDSGISANSPAEGVARVQQQHGFRRYVGLAGDNRNHSILRNLEGAFEHASDDTLLPPDLPWLHLAVLIQAGEFGAGPRAAGRAIVSLPGAEHEVLAVHSLGIRRTE